MLRKAPSTTIWPDGTEPKRFVLANEASGSVYAADAKTVRLLDHLDGRTGDAQAAERAGLEPREAEEIAKALIANGLVIADGATQAPQKRRRPWETRLVFFRLDLLDIAPLVDRVAPVLSPVFTGFGFIVWLGVLGVALFGLIAEPEAVRDALLTLPEMSWQTAIALVLAFTVLKAIHELGHAAALRIFADAEGVRLGPIRSGIAFFAGLPFPFTDATAAWKLRSRYRRAAIGIAGVYLESWVAAAAAILWSQVTPGELQTFLIQLLLVGGFSTLFFNLNPLVRLDGYYIFCDLAGLPNLATRAALAARGAGLWLLGGRTAAGGKAGYLCYLLLSYAYRWVIFVGIFWIAYAIDLRLAWVVAGISVMTLVVRPLMTLSGELRRQPIQWRRATLTAGGLAAVVAAFAVPLPDAEHIDGRLIRHRVEVVRANDDALLSQLATLPTAQSPIVVLENKELQLTLAEMQADQALLAGQLRSLLGGDATERRIVESERNRLSEQIAETEGRIAALTVAMPETALWEPEDAPKLAGAWVAAVENRVLGRIALPAEPHLLAHIDQARSDLGDHLRDGDAIAFRPVVRPRCTATALARGFAPVVEDGVLSYSVMADLPTESRCWADLPAGSAVVLRVVKRDAPLALQLYDRARRLAQNRLPRELSQ